MTQRRRLGALDALLFLAAASVLLFDLGDYRPLTPHEVLVAQPAREILETGRWLAPTYFGEPRLKKPPLATWETAAAFRLFGVNEFAARLPSAAAALGLVFLVWLMARDHGGPRVGRWAGFAAATSVWSLTHGRLAEVDMTLAFLIAAGTLAFLKSPRDRRWGSVFWITAGLAALAKGPVGPILLGAIVLVSAAARRSATELRALGTAWTGMFLFLAIGLAWPLATLCVYPNARGIWLEETLGRFAEDPNGVERRPLYYLTASLWMLAPWTPATIGGILWGRRGATWRHWLSWLLAPMAILSLSAGKQEHYLAPALAAGALFAGVGLARAERWTVRRWAWAKCRSTLLIGPAAVVATILFIARFVEPTIHGRRGDADWFARESKTIPAGEPIIALGHSVQWLVFYHDGPMRRVDALDDFLTMNLEPGAWVLTTPAVARNFTGRVSQLEIRSRLRGEKTPILVRIAPLSVSQLASPSPRR